MASSSKKKGEARKVRVPRRGRWRRRVGVLLVLGGLAALVDGPGARWGMRQLALSQAEAQGLEGDLVVTGSLHSGIGIADLDLKGEGAIVRVRMDRLETRWNLLRLVKGEVDVLRGRGIRAVVDLAAEEEAVAEEEKEAPKSEDGGEGDALASARKFFLPLEIDLRDVSLDLLRDGKPYITLGPTALKHRAEDDLLTMEIGSLEVAGLPSLAAQQVELRWTEEELDVARVALVDGWVLEGLTFNPGDGDLNLGLSRPEPDTRLAIVVREKFDEVEVQLKKGAVDVARLLAPFLAEPLPLKAVVTKLQAKVKGVSAGLEGMRADLEVGGRDLAWDDWELDGLQVQANGGADALAANIQADWLGTRLGISAAFGQLSKGQSGPWWEAALVRVHELEISRLEGAGRQLRDRFLPTSAGAPFPQGTLAVLPGAGFSWGPHGFEIVSAVLVAPNWMVGNASVPPLQVGFGLKGSHLHDARVTLGPIDDPLLAAEGEADLGEGTYRAELEAADGFATGPLASLAEVAAVSGIPHLRLTLDWSGSGNWNEGSHAGIAQLDLPRQMVEGVGEAMASLEARYDWPKSAEILNLRAEVMGFEGEVQAGYEKKRVEVERIAVNKEGNQLLRASLSVPLDPEARSLDALVDQPGEIAGTIAVPERTLAGWLALGGLETSPVDGRASASLRLGGTLARPTVAGQVSTVVNRVEAAPELPKVEIDLELVTREEVLHVTGATRQEGLDPITLEAALPFTPRAWMDDPQAIRREEIRASLTLPQIPLERYAELAPGVKELAGVVGGEVRVTGALEKLVVDGRISLREGLVRPDNPSVATVRDLNLTIVFDASKARIEEGGADLSGGSLSLLGAVDFSDMEKVRVDVAAKGDHLLAWRGDLAIVRVSPDLTFAGTPGAFRLGGRIDVVESLVHRDFQIIPLGADLGLPSKPQVAQLEAPRVPEAAEKGFPSTVALDVVVASAEPVRIAGNLATGRVTADLRAGGTLAVPEFDGAVTLDEAQATLPFSTLTIRQGKALFSPEGGLVPRLEVVGISRINPYIVRLMVRGEATSPKIVLTSEPPLPENEIMTLLATGSTTSSLENTDNASSKAIQLLISELRRGRLPYGRRLAKLLAPLENVQLGVGQENPYTGTSLNSASLALGERFLLTGAVDEEGNPRGTLTFFLRFK